MSCMCVCRGLNFEGLRGVTIVLLEIVGYPLKSAVMWGCSILEMEGLQANKHTCGQTFLAHVLGKLFVEQIFVFINGKCLPQKFHSVFRVGCHTNSALAALHLLALFSFYLL